jgi:nucleoid DNA-binding protein
MQAIITSYLIQKKECNLPLLGHFRIKSKPADFEKSNQRIFPPTDEILYSEFAAKLSGDLLTYISARESITVNEAEEKINNWCDYARKKIDLGGKIIFDSLGSLQKDAVGNVFFQRKKGFGFYEPVSAETIQKNGGHTLVTGDTESSSVTSNEFYREEKIKKRTWWKIWAIVLTAISLIILVLHFYLYKFSETGIGSKASIPIQAPPASYRTP